MNRILFTMAFALVATLCFAQSDFVPGYYIDNQGNKKEGLIRNEQWSNNPKKISFKSSASDNPNELRVDQVSEFGIGTDLRFVKADVRLDRSSSKPIFYTDTKEPQFSSELLFLKVLLTGKANLYSYQEGDLLRYFYSVNNQPIEQLIYKIYRSSQSSISYNNSYKSQLKEALQCEAIDLNRLKKVEYTRKSLTAIFIDYNSCKGGATKVLNKNKVPVGKINIKAVAGYQFSVVDFQSDVFQSDFSFDNDSNPFFGAEVELILSRGQGDWALVAQPVLLLYKSTERTVSNTSSGVDYTGILLPLLVRRYFSVNQKPGFYINGGLSSNIPLSKSFSWGTRTDIITDSMAHGIALGAGVLVSEKIRVDLMHHFKRNILANFSAFKSNMSSTQLGISYKFN